MRRPFAFLFSGILAVTLLTAGALISSSPVSAATVIAPTTTCSNGVDDTPGLGLICRVTIVNTITQSGGTAAVTVRECHGAAGDPSAACSVTSNVLGSPVTAVNQCNYAINGGGGTLRCSVDVTNNFVGLSPSKTAVPVDQCVGSGGGIHVGCDPFPATSASAIVTQCNGSANGGTLVGLTCTVTGSQASRNNVRVNQCNNSANGGGSLVICSASLVNHIIIAAPTPTPTPRPTATPTARPTAPPTPTPTLAPTPTPVGATPTPTLAPTPTATATAPTPSPTEIVNGPKPSLANTTATPAATRGPHLPNTNTDPGTDSSAGSSPLLPIGLLLLVGLGMVAWFKRQNSAASAR